MVDVFLLFDDTGSFTLNSPIVCAAFPNIISQLETRLPGIDLGFGVGRLEEYGNFAAEYANGRPFVLNQPIISSSDTGYTDAEVLDSIQAALDHVAPGYGGDQPETVIEALYQMVTGAGFDGNNDGDTTDSGPAGRVFDSSQSGKQRRCASLFVVRSRHGSRWSRAIRGDRWRGIPFRRLADHHYGNRHRICISAEGRDDGNGHRRANVACFEHHVQWTWNNSVQQRRRNTGNGHRPQCAAHW